MILHNNVNGDSYRQLLETEMVPCARAHFGRNFLLQHNNSPPHRAREVHDSPEEKEIDQIDWQPYLPDMNPIENLWDYLGRQIRQRPRPPANLQELEQCLLDEWQRVTPDVTRR